MYARQNLIELFSTFIQFSDDKFHKWLIEPKLKKNISIFLKQESLTNKSEYFWSVFWYKQWQNKSHILAKNHLLAYLQEPCYWASQKIVARFSNLPYKLSDCFQIAIAEIDQVLKGYNLNYGSSLSSYATLTFNTIINNTFKQKLETDICTDWGLLRKVSKKRLIASLQKAGFNQEKIDFYCLAWICFNKIYIPKQKKISQKLPAPTQETWQAITIAYQQESINYPSLVKQKHQITPIIIEKNLQQAAYLIRQYLYPKATSLNITLSQEDSGELLDIISDNDKSPLEYLILEEEVKTRENNQGEINKIIIEAIDKLKPEIKDIFQLYYQENLTQQEIAAKLDIKQYTISRKITRGRELLLHELLKWSQNSLNIKIHSEKIKEMSLLLEEWLNIHYK